MWEVLDWEGGKKGGATFLMAGVPSRSKMYRTSATCEIHSILHVAQKNKVYVVHFANEVYTLIPDVVYCIKLKIMFRMFG